MRVRVKKTFEIPGKPAFLVGKEYNLEADLANLLIARGLVEEVVKVAEIKEETEPTEEVEEVKPKKSKKSNK